jgi:hypothetical protein
MAANLPFWHFAFGTKCRLFRKSLQTQGGFSIGVHPKADHFAFQSPSSSLPLSCGFEN